MYDVTISMMSYFLSWNSSPNFRWWYFEILCDEWSLSKNKKFFNV